MKDVTKLDDVTVDKLLNKYLLYVKTLKKEKLRRAELAKKNTVVSDDIEPSAQSAKLAAIKKMISSKTNSNEINRSGRFEKISTSSLNPKKKTKKRINKP
jgi:hypothetical protein